MDTNRQSNGLQTFLEHWGFLVLIIVVCLTAEGIRFFVKLSGAPWNWFFVSSSTLLITGGGLIGYAKFSAYRNGRFFTFGLASVPESLRGVYRWGCRLFFIGVVLSLCLLLSNA